MENSTTTASDGISDNRTSIIRKRKYEEIDVQQPIKTEK